MSVSKTIKLSETTHRRLKVVSAEMGVSLGEMIDRMMERLFPAKKKRPADDPLYQAFMNAPEDDEPYTAL